MSGDSRTLYVGNISDRVTEELLYELFLQAGPLERVAIPKDKDGKKRKFAFVTFKHEASVPYTLQLFEGLGLYGRTLNVKFRNGNQDAGSPTLSPGMSPPVMHPSASSPRLNQGYGPGQLHRSNTWHGNLSGEGTSGERQYHRQESSSPSPDSFRSRPRHFQNNPGQVHQSSRHDRYGQVQNQGWFNQGSPMLPRNIQQSQSSDMRLQRILQQQTALLVAYRQQHPIRHQNYAASPWQQQSQRYGRY